MFLFILNESYNLQNKNFSISINSVNPNITLIEDVVNAGKCAMYIETTFDVMCGFSSFPPLYHFMHIMSMSRNT